MERAKRGVCRVEEGCVVYRRGYVEWKRGVCRVEEGCVVYRRGYVEWKKGVWKRGV